MTLSLRSVAPGDTALVRALFAAARIELDGLPEALVAMQVEAQRRDYATRFPDADEHVVMLDGNAVGRLWVHRRGNIWRVLDITLLEGARGSGIGTQLLTRLIADADRAGVPLRLSVAHDNHGARRLYTRLGFATVAVDELWVVMERPLRCGASLRAIR